jgi:hypothetical protein
MRFDEQLLCDKVEQGGATKGKRHFQSRFFGIFRSKQHVVIIALCRGHVLANLLFASATEFQDVELHSLAFSLVRFHAITIEQLQDARPTAHWESRLNSCSNLVA